MKELQMLINKWKQEADLLKQSHKEMFNPYHPLTAEYKRLRKCITEAELLLSEVQPNSDVQPQLPQAPVSLSLAGLEADAVEDAYAYSETHEDVSDRIGQHLVKSAYLDGARSVIQKLKANAS